MITPSKQELLEQELTFIKVIIDCSIVLPFKDGIKLLETLEHAEIHKHFYNDKVDRIYPITEEIKFETMSQEKYLTSKMNQLLNPFEKNSY